MKNYHQRFWIGVLIIFGCLAIAIRLVDGIKFYQFAGDEGIQLLVVSHLLKYGAVPISGEISGIDKVGSVIIHNSTWGFGLQTILFLLGGMTAEGYTLMYGVLNLIVIAIWTYIAYKTVNTRAAIVVFGLLSFSTAMIIASSWTSQPINAIFGESVAAILAYWGYRRKKLWMWLLAYGGGLLAIQFYPPMYIYLPWFLGGFLAGTNKLHWFNRKLLLTLVLITILVYAPKIYFEYKYDFIDLKTLWTYLNHTQVYQNEFSYFTKLLINLKGLATVFDYQLRPGWQWIVLLSAFLILRILKSASHYRKLWWGIAGLTVYSFIIVSLIETYPNYIYLYPLLPLYVLLLGASLGQIDRYVFGVIAILLFGFLISGIYKFAQVNKVNALSRAQKIARVISTDANRKGIDIKTIDLYVVSSGNEWNWEAPLFWYELEKKVGLRLADIDPLKSLAKRYSPDLRKGVYMICLDETGEGLDENKCGLKFPGNYISLYHLWSECKPKSGHEIYREKTVTVNYIPLECSAT